MLDMMTEHPELFTRRQRALLRDAGGLLGSIAAGMVTTGQPRICSNLIEAISLFDDRYPDQAPAEVDKIVDNLLSILGSMGAVGYTANAHTLTPDGWSKKRGASR